MTQDVDLEIGKVGTHGSIFYARRLKNRADVTKNVDVDTAKMGLQGPNVLKIICHV